MAAVFPAMDWFSPWMMSLSVWLSAISEITSDSANTVHMLEMVSSFSHVRPRRLISSISSSSVRAIISRNRPVRVAIHKTGFTKQII